MGADFVGITAFISSGLDRDYIICAVMIVAGFVMIKKCTGKLFLTRGRLLFALGWGVLAWMILWQITPGIMAQVIYGVRI